MWDVGYEIRDMGRRTGVMEYWSIGVWGFWADGVMEHWSSGVLEK